MNTFWITQTITITLFCISIIGILCLLVELVKQYKNNKYILLMYLIFVVCVLSGFMYVPWIVEYFIITDITLLERLFGIALVICSAFLCYKGRNNYSKYGFMYSVFPFVILLGVIDILLLICKNPIIIICQLVLILACFICRFNVYIVILEAEIQKKQFLKIMSFTAFCGCMSGIVLFGSGITSYASLCDLIITIIEAVLIIMVLKIMNSTHARLDLKLYDTEWDEYPRPQLKRGSFYNLNGIWSLNGKSIRVPFAPQSSISGYKGTIQPDLEYKRQFILPEEFNTGRVLLNFGAVDEEAVVYVNEQYVGEHKGGYLPFSFDITDKLIREKGHINELKVKVKDTLSGLYPYGKQRNKRGGMWYTPVSGIWQTVWLERVPFSYIERLIITPASDSVEIKVILNNISEDENMVAAEVGISKSVPCTAYITVESGQELVKHFNSDEAVKIDINNPHLWTVDDPHLYSMRIKAGEDIVYSYFALRTIDIQKTGSGQRVCLNGKPIYINGVLDQGYFCDGIYTPISCEAYKDDILNMKELGFNTLRKHIKIEPDIFYYYCDKYGMLVIQDMVNNGGYSFVTQTMLPTFGRVNKREKDNKKLSSFEIERRKIFIQLMKDTSKQLYNHPSVVMYTIFNEGWGQFDSDKMYELLKTLDNTRLIDTTSGWFSQTKSDFDSRHIYFKTQELTKKEKPLFLSECGGYSYIVDSHIYSIYTHYGYGNCSNKEDFTSHITQMYETMIIPALDSGLIGSIYTQLSDVEDETNGIYTYDRKVCKVNKQELRRIADKINEKFNK